MRGSAIASRADDAVRHVGWPSEFSAPIAACRTAASGCAEQREQRLERPRVADPRQRAGRRHDHRALAVEEAP